MSAYGRPSGRDRDADDEIVEIDTVAVVVPDDAQAGDADDTDDTVAIQEQIEQTRSDMSETIDAIQQKLSPQRIGEQVREQVHDATIGRAEQMVSDVTDTARQAGGGILDMIRENPVPTALATIGLGWLWMKRPSHSPGQSRRGRYRSDVDYRDDDASGYGYRDYGYRGNYGSYRAGGERGGAGDVVHQTGQRAQRVASQATGAVQGVAGQAADAVQGVAGQASGAVQQAAGQVQDTAQQLGTQVQYGAQRARYGFEDALQENPLGMGAIALAVGVAVGLAAPTSNLENHVMGDTRDTVMHKAQETAQDTLQKVQNVAQHTAESTKETARQEAQKEGLTSSKG